MRAFLASSALLLLVCAPVSAANEACDAPPALIESYARLPRVSLSVKRDKKLEILVVSAAPSQTGAASGLKNYPAFLEQDLKRRLKEIEVSVVAHAEPRKSIKEVSASFPKLLEEWKPNLVIWQTGTVEAMRGMDPDTYGELLKAGVETLLKANADVILVNQQYSPRTDFMFDGGPYTDNMRWVSQTKDIPLFNRYEIMKHWSETGVFDLTALRNDGTYEKLHRCLGGLLSDLVIRAASLPGNVER